MNPMRIVLFVAVTFFMVNGHVRAENKVTLDKTESVNVGEATGEGTYQLDAGWKVEGIDLYFRQCGVTIKTVACDFGKGKFKGLAIQLNSTETYQVQAVMAISHATLGDDAKTSNEKDVTIK